MDKNNTIQNSRRMVIILAGLSVFLLIICVYGWVGRYQAKAEAATAQSNLYQVALALGTTNAQVDEAEEQAYRARALQLALQAQTIYSKEDSKREAAVLLAIESMRLLPTGEAAITLQNNTLAYPISRMNHRSRISSVAFSPEGKYVASASWDGSIRLWDAIAGKEIAYLTHGKSVISVAFSHDGEYVVSAGCDQVEGYSCVQGSARIWEVATGKESRRLKHDEVVTFVVFSPDDKYIVSGGCGITYDANYLCKENFARVWDVSTGKELARLPHNFFISFAAINSDGKYIVTSGCDKELITHYCVRGFARVWEMPTGREIAALESDQYITSVAISQNGRYVASGSRYGVARIWKVETGEEIARMTHNADVTSIAFSPDGKYVVSAGGKSIRVWETTTGKEILHLTPDDYPQLVAFSPDGKYVVSGGYKTARVWDVATGQEIARMAHTDQVTSIAFSPDGNYVISGSHDGITQVWGVTDQSNVRQIQHKKDFGNSLAFSASGEYVVSGTEDGQIRVWEISKGEEIFQTQHFYGDHIDSLNISPDGRYIAVASRERGYDWEPWRTIVSVWDVFVGNRVAWKESAFSVESVAISPDNTYIASGSIDSNVSVWEIATGKEIARMSLCDFDMQIIYDMSHLMFSPDGAYLVSGGSDGVVRVWGVSTGQEIIRMTNAGSVTSVAISYNGKYVVSGYNNLSVRVWEVSTGKEISRMTPDDGVASVAFSPDGQYVISGGFEMVRIWEASTGKEISRMIHHGVQSVSFTPDGHYALSGSYAGAVRNWKWRPEDLIADACSRVTRNLTRSEWQRYIGDFLPYQAVCPNLPIEPEPIPMGTIPAPTMIPTRSPIPATTP